MMEILLGDPFLDQVKNLLIKYINVLGRDLQFQGIEDELSDLAGKYTHPEGKLLTACIDGTVCGMVAYHRHSTERCEMKRLYVEPGYRGQHIGEKLVKEILDCAKADGYREMVLDTLQPMKSAIGLYRKFGFQECEPYYDNPMSDVIYMKKML